MLFATVALIAYRCLLPGRDTGVELDTQGVEVVPARAARPGPRIYVTLLMLVLIAIVLGIETKSLLVGEGATTADLDRIVDAIAAGDEVEKLIHIKTLYLGPDELMVAAKIALTADKSVREAADDIDEIEARIREAVPAARVIYIEPDVYRPAIDPEPPTDAFVLKSSD